MIPQFSQFSRQIVLPEIGPEGQERLFQARVLVVGAGGLGCPALQYLTTSGIGTLGIIDYDIVEESNLHRQVLYHPAQIGRPKVEAAREALQKLNPLLHIITYFEKLNRENILGILSQFDLVLEGSDNFPTKYLVNDACILSGKPFILGGVHQFEGQLSVFNYQNGPSYKCLIPDPPYQTHIPSCAEEGVIGPVPGFIGCLMALEAIKIITGAGVPLSGQLLHVNALRWEVQIMAFEKNPTNFVFKEMGHYPEPSCKLPDGLIAMSAAGLLDWVRQEKAFMFVDIREKPTERLPFTNYQSIPYRQLETNHWPFQESDTLILACEYGIMSEKMAAILFDRFGLTGLYHLETGIQGLIQDPLWPKITAACGEPDFST